MDPDLILTLCGLFIIIVTVLPFCREGLWWVRILDFPCAQFAFLGVMILITWLVLYLQEQSLFYSTAMIPFLVGSLLIQGYRIYPYTIFSHKESTPCREDDPERTISILSANVLMDNRNSHQLMQFIEMSDPDLILLTEANHWWEQAMKPLETRYDYTIKQPLENTYGILLYSRFSLIDSEIKFLVEDDVPSIHTTLRIFSGETVDFYGLHPRPPRIGQDVHERDAELLIVGRRIKERQRPAIVAGDLNDVAWSHSTRLFIRQSGLEDPRIGRGFFNTFPTYVTLLRFPMDHIFHSKHFGFKQLQVLEAFGSDHYPIFAVLQCHHDKKISPSISHEVRREALEKITKGLEPRNQTATR